MKRKLLILALFTLIALVTTTAAAKGETPKPNQKPPQPTAKKNKPQKPLFLLQRKQCYPATQARQMLSVRGYNRVLSGTTQVTRNKMGVKEVWAKYKESGPKNATTNSRGERIRTRQMLTTIAAIRDNQLIMCIGELVTDVHINNLVPLVGAPHKS